MDFRSSKWTFKVFSHKIFTLRSFLRPSTETQPALHVQKAGHNQPTTRLRLLSFDNFQRHNRDCKIHWRCRTSKGHPLQRAHGRRSHSFVHFAQSNRESDQHFVELKLGQLRRDVLAEFAQNFQLHFEQSIDGRRGAAREGAGRVLHSN